MKRIAILRPTLATIPDCLYELPPEETPRGHDLAVSTVWDAEVNEADSSGKLAPAEPIEEEGDGLDQEPPPLEELFEFGADVDQDRLVEAFGGSEGERIRRSILQERGTDALAWYVTFHARGVQWGAYIPTSSLFYLATTVFGGLKVDLATRIRISFRALHQHELFHFAVNYMAAQWEGITGKPCHKPARSLRDRNRGYILLEEQLANASMIRSFWGGRSSLRVRGRSDALRTFVRQQPPGYSNAEKVVAATAFSRGCEDLASAYIGKITGYSSRYIEAVDLARIYPLSPAIDWRHCPIHVLHDGARLGLPPIDLGLFRSVAGIVESDRFRKQLGSMPRAVQAAWERTKEILAVNPQVGGLNFKLWERRPGQRIYSVRLSRSYRAHLAYHEEARQWTAVDVGGHHAMGHG